MRTKIYSLVALLLVLVGAAVYWSGLFQRDPIPEHLLNMGGDFTLQSADGPVALQDLRGKVVLIYFGFTNCADACPLTLNNWGRAFDQLSEKERSRTVGMLVSVDPARDTPQMLKKYTAYFHPNIIGVTGTEAQLREIVDLYRSDFVIEKQESDADYEVAHMSFVYVIDPEGNLRALLAHESPLDDIVNTIRYVLRVAG